MSGQRSVRNPEVIQERPSENSRRDSVSKSAERQRLQRPATSIQHSRKISRANHEFGDMGPTGVSPRLPTKPDQEAAHNYDDNS